jgi:hypothetical protein
MSKVNLPDGGQYRVENAKKNKVRIFYDETVDGFRLRDKVVKTPADIQSLSQDGLTTLVNSMIHRDKEVVRSVKN